MIKMSVIAMQVLLLLLMMNSSASTPDDGYYCNSKGIFTYQRSQLDFDGQVSSTLNALYLNDTVSSKRINLPAMQIGGNHYTHYKNTLQSVKEVSTYQLFSNTGAAIKPKLIATRKANKAKTIVPPKLLY